MRATEPPRWLPPLLLALPFVVGIAVLRGLTVEIDTFHASDARVYQLPTILQLSERLDLSDYPSAQTPLYHLLTAGWGKLVGFDLWKLRLLNVAFSYAMALALLRLLRRATPLAAWPAFALTLLFVLSPYVLGTSFTLLTDNLAILFALLALERIHAWSRSESLGDFGLACAAIAAALLTRQAFIWLVPLAAFFLVTSSAPPQRRYAGAGLLALAVVPLGALVLDWNGLVPPSADPASCGLCEDRQGLARDALSLRTVGFTVALAGGYGAFVFGPSLWRRLRRLRSSALARTWVGLTGQVREARRLVGAAIAVGVVLLLVSPLAYRPITAAAAGDAGYLWKLSDRFRSCSALHWRSGCSCRSAAWPSLCSSAAPGSGRCPRSTSPASCWRRCRCGSAIRSTSIPSCCSGWPSWHGRRTSSGAGTTRASRSCAWPSWPTRSASRTSGRLRKYARVRRLRTFA